MEQNKAERLNENVTEKMCSSDGNVVGEMCSPADADTAGRSGVCYGGGTVTDHFCSNNFTKAFLQTGI